MSCYVMNARVTFAARSGRGEILLRQLQQLSLQGSCHELTARAVITLPRNVTHRRFDRDRVRDVFRPGDGVKIELGYNGAYIKEFEGYVTEVSAGIPLVLKCEDEMWKLKQIPVNYSKPDVNLKHLLSDILPTYTLEANQREPLGAVRFSQTTAAAVLQKLQQEKHIDSYFKEKTLISGKDYSDHSPQGAHCFSLERNVVRNDLHYKTKRDVKVLILARALIKGVKKEYRIGDPTGQVYKLDYSGQGMTQALLQQKAQADYNRKKTDGFQGSFTAFGLPSVKQGEKVHLQSQLYKERDGIYHVEGVSKSFSPRGYRQEIKLGAKL